MIAGIRSFTVMTGSMEPTVHTGAIVFTRPEKVYKTGDIIAFKKGDIVITHRIIDVESKNNSVSYKTQGDANNSEDSEPVLYQSILGHAFFNIPYLGRFVFFLKTIPGFFIFIVLPAGVFIIFEIINIKNEIVREVEKKYLSKNNLFP